MGVIQYDSSSKSLFKPGESDDFFQLDSSENYLKNEAGLCAEMSRLAYVNDESKLEYCLDRINFKKDISIGYKDNGTSLFITTNNSTNITIVSFRGTEADDPSDLFTDANFIFTQWKNRSSAFIGKVHSGFAEALTKNDILNKVIEYVNSKSESNRILLTGHSLGAALATLTSSWLPSAHLYTFGSPRVGDISFVNSIQKIEHIRFVDCCDIVTEVPFENLGYVHSGKLQYINRKGHLLNSPGENEMSLDRNQAKSDYFVHQAFLRGTVAFRELADHAPINYVTGVMGLRTED
ncbi:MAG: lipase family protein [Spirochaetia bacterium]|nr:lipase family protein [Spirochaetia bacterium]